jgi:hypothetical protein
MKYEDIRKKYGLGSGSNSSEKETDKPTNSYEEIRKRYGLTSSELDVVDSDYINTFISDANSFLGSAENDYNSVGWGNAFKTYLNRDESWNDLSSRANLVRKWLDKNKNKLDTKTYDELSKSISTILEGGNSVIGSFKNASDFYEQFDTEDSYNAWKTYSETIDKVVNAEDYEKYYQLGANVENPAYKDAKIDQHNLWENIFKDDVTNPVTFGRNNKEDLKKRLTSSVSSADVAAVDQYLKYELMTEDEANVYNYYLGKGETEKANEYLAYIDDALAQRRAGKVIENIGDNKLLAVAIAFGAGLEQFATGFRNLDNYIMGTEADATSTGQYISAGLRENLNGGWGVAYDFSQTMGNMLPSVLVGSITGGVGGALTMGASAMGNAYAEMRNLGYDEGQARGYGFLVGASEAGLQYIMGGISKLGGKVSGKALGNFVSKFDNAIARTAITLGGNMISEGAEEAIQTILEPAFKSLVTGEEFEAAEWEDIWYSALLGALSAGVMDGVPTVAGEVKRSNTANKVYGTPNATANLVNQGLEFAEGTEARTLAEKYNTKLTDGKKLSGSQLAHLAEASDTQYRTDDTAKLKNSILQKLGELGETNDVTPIADVLVKYALGEKLSSKDINILNNSNHGYKVMNGLNKDNIKSGNLSDNWAASIGTKRISPEAYNKDLYAIAKAVSEGRKTAEKNAVAKTIADSEAVKNMAHKTSESGKTIYKDADGNAEDVTINKIVSTDGGIKVELDNGKTAKATDLEFGTAEEAMMYEMVARMGVTPETANEIISAFKPANAKQSLQYLSTVPLAYQYGKMGYEAGLENIALSKEQRKLAYNRGRVDAMTQVKSHPSSSIKSNPNPTASTKKNGIIFEDGFVYDEKSANELQKKSMIGIETIDKMSNLEVHVFESKVVNGKRVAYVKGKLVKAPNGYFTDGNKVYIDINSGSGGEGAMLYTMSHEVVHYIRKWNAKGFKELGDFLIEQYGEQGVAVHKLLEAQKEKIKKRYKEEKKTLPSEAKLADMAYEELVADAMSDMFTDPRAYEKLAKLKQKNHSLWQKLGEAIKALLDKLKTALGIYRTEDVPVAREAYEVRGFTYDVYNKLQDLYLKAFVEADANYEATIGSRNLKEFEAAMNENGEPLLQYRAMEADEDTYREMLHKWGKMSNVQINNLFATIDTAMELIKDNLEILDYAWEADIDDRAFSPVKPNSDKLYQVSLDFSTLCRKRILQQTVQTQLQEALNKPLTREEGIAIRDALIALQEEGRQIEVACALCYVESARMKSPEQIKRFIENKEKVIREFFAGKSDGSIKDKVKKAEADARIRLGVGNASLKSLPGKVAQEIRDAKKAAKASYAPTVEEQKLIEVAKGMTVSDFTSSEGLENLAKKYPRLFDAYTSYIRNATKSKGIEGDTWWRAGDSNSIGDVLIANMNKENGLRTQSWSDFQVVHILDYIASTIELATRNTKEQAYSKVPDYVELMGNTGVMINMSLIPTATFNGSLDYDSVEGIDYKRALELRDKYHATAGTICIGVDNVQIKLLLADTTIDYIIPYHKSGMSKALRKLMHLPTWSDYESYQSESKLSRADAEKQAKKHGVKLLDSSDPNYQKGTSFSEWFDLQEAQQIAKMENANPSDKAKQKKYGVMYGGYMAMQNAANNYLKLCAERGLSPKFSHEKADFTTEENYWKLLIDRKMVDNVTGEVIEQQTIKPIFNEGEIMRILNDELARYPKVKEDQDYAIRRVTEKMLSGEVKGGMSAEAIAKVMKKPVDNVTNVNILASAEDIYSYQNYSASDYYTNSKIYSYDFLTAQEEMVKVKLPETGALADRKGKIDDGKVLAEGIKNALSEGNERDGKVYVKNAYTGRELRIDNSTIKHGLDGTYNRHLTNARIGSVIGSVVKNAIPINGLKNSSEKAIGTYAMVAYCYDSMNREFIAIVTVEQHTGNVDSFELYDVAHAVSGRQKKGSQVDTKSQGVYPIEATTISIADLLQIVNSTHQSILSEDVLAHFGETRNPNGGYSDKVLFSDRDSTYLDAVNHGDMGTAQRMVDEAAKEAGYTYKGYHGTRRGGFTVFKNRLPGMIEGLKSIFLAKDEGTAGQYAYGSNRKIYSLYAKMENPLIVDCGHSAADNISTGNKPEIRELARKYLRGAWETFNPNDNLTTDQIGYLALRSGKYDGVIFKNVNDSYTHRNITDVYEVFEPDQVKSADTVTYDDDGNVIPLSERFKKDNPDIRFSDRDSYAPTFYSHMGKVIDGIKLEKMGANGVVSFLKGKGVKDEEIKWSGIEAFLEGKKSVTKAELQEFVAGSQLQIEEEAIGETGIDKKELWDNFRRQMGDVLSWLSPEEIDDMCFDYDGDFSAEKFKSELQAYVDDESISEMQYEEAVEYAEEMEEGLNSGGTRWGQYKLEGGYNYRELLFKIPNSTYSNQAMQTHWGEDAEGVLAHARIQDFEVDGKNMLFIEEIQSDWHNEGHKVGYAKKLSSKEEQRVAEIEDEYSRISRERAWIYAEMRKFVLGGDKYNALKQETEPLTKQLQELQAELDRIQGIEVTSGATPDAPFRDTYHEYVLKRLLRMAAEEGYDSIGWTTADIQSKRWSEDYAEGYRIEYDQEMPKFLRKYGKKWGATVEKIDIVEGKNLAELESDLLQMEAQADGADGSERRLLENNIAIYKDRIDNLKVGVGTDVVWSMGITDSMQESVLYEGQVMYSDRVTDQETLDFLENQEHITTFKSFVEIDGKLYSPMATKVKGDDGKYRLTNPSEIGVWQQAEEKPDSIPKFHKSGYGYYVLKKDDGGSVTAAYNPYEHSSNLVLNDQFESAYQRPNLVTVECVIPKSEMTSGYKAKYAKDSTGYLDWKSGTVAGKLKGNKRKVYLSRWLKPVRILSDAEVASMYKDILGTKISVPFNVVTPQLRTELEKVGVKIDYEGSPGYQYRQSKKATDADTKLSDRDTDVVSNRTILANALENIAQNDVEKNKLKQYKDKIALIESEQKKLNEIRERANKLRFTKGRTPDETKQMRDLDFEANQTANRINTYDKQLLNLESTAALKGVLEREKAMLRKRLKQQEKESIKAYKEKAAETQRELLTRYQESRKNAVESRNKTAMRHKIKNIVSDLNKLLLNPTKDQHVPIGLQKVVAEALDVINMDTMNAEERVAYYNNLISKSTNPDEIAMLTKKRDFFEYRDANFKDRITALKNAYAEFKESDDPLIRNAHNEAIENLIKDTAEGVGNKSLKDMSIDQLEAVYDMYKAILATVRNSNKMFKEDRQATVSDNSEAVKTEVREVGGHHDRVRKLTKFLTLKWKHLKPIYALQRIGSNTLARLFENVRVGEETYAVDINEAREFFQNQTKKYNHDSWDFKKRYSFKDSAGNEFELSLEQILSLYAYSKREQADKHLEFGGFVFDDTIEVIEKGTLGIPMKYEVNDATPYRLRAEDLATVIGSLTTEQKAFVDEMQTYLSDVMGAKGNEISLAMYDIKMFKEKHYFPLKTSRYFREYNPEQTGNPMLRNSGFTKKTVPQAGNPIVLSNFMDVWTNHVNDMSMYHSFVLPLEDFMRVYNYSSTAGGYDSVQQYIKNAYGAEANQYIEQLMQDINGGVMSGNLPNGWLKWFGKFKKAAVAASLSTIVQQPTAVIRAMAIINPKYFAGIPFKGSHKNTWEEIKKYAPIAIIKEMGGFDVGSGRQAKDFITSQTYKGLGKIKGFFTDSSYRDSIFMWGATKADEMGWNSIWKAVKREVASKQNLKPGTEEFFKACGKRFTEVVTQTQVYDSVFARSGIMRNKGDLDKFATSFMGEPTTSFNMIYNAILSAKRGGGKAQAVRTISSVYVSIVSAAALASLIYALRDDDEDEAYLEKWAEAFGNKLSSEIWIHNMIPYIRDIASILEGWDVERPDMSIFSDIKSSFDKLFKINDDGEFEWKVDFSDPEAVYGAIENFGGSIASAFGLPLKNLMRDTRGIYNGFKAIFDDIHPTDVGGAFVEGFTGEEKPKSESLYEAIINGDEGRLKVYREGYKDDKAYETAVKSALREHDPRIKEAAQARYNGDIATYTSIAKRIIAEGNFSQDIVVGAINAEITAIKNGEASEDKPSNDKDEATSIYKSSDINDAFESGDNSLALKIIDELVSTKVANGKTEKEAKSSVRSSMTSYWKPLYKNAYQSGNSSEMERIRRILYSSDLYGSVDDVVKTCQNWLKD